MAEMKMHANKVIELASKALIDIDVRRSIAHDDAICKFAADHTVFSWWSGSKSAPLSIEEASKRYDERRQLLDHYYTESPRKTTDRPFDAEKRHVEGLVDIARRSLAYSDGFITLDQADAKALIPQRILTDG